MAGDRGIVVKWAEGTMRYNWTRTQEILASEEQLDASATAVKAVFGHRGQSVLTASQHELTLVMTINKYLNPATFRVAAVLVGSTCIEADGLISVGPAACRVTSAVASTVEPASKQAVSSLLQAVRSWRVAHVVDVLQDKLENLRDGLRINVRPNAEVDLMALLADAAALNNEQPLAAAGQAGDAADDDAEQPFDNAAAGDAVDPDAGEAEAPEEEAAADAADDAEPAAAAEVPHRLQVAVSERFDFKDDLESGASPGYTVPRWFNEQAAYKVDHGPVWDQKEQTYMAFSTHHNALLPGASHASWKRIENDPPADAEQQQGDVDA